MRRGFTLIEVLIVLALIAILAGIALVAINPARQFAQARHAQRTSHLQVILNAIGQRMADNKGIFAGSFTVSGATYVCGPVATASTSVTTAMAGNAVDETGALGCLVPVYVPALPIDPAGAVEPQTGYEIRIHGGRVTVCAPGVADETAITDPPPALCATR